MYKYSRISWLSIITIIFNNCFYYFKITANPNLFKNQATAMYGNKYIKYHLWILIIFIFYFAFGSDKPQPKIQL